MIRLNDDLDRLELFHSIWKTSYLGSNSYEIMILFRFDSSLKVHWHWIKIDNFVRFGEVLTIWRLLIDWYYCIYLQKALENEEGSSAATQEESGAETEAAPAMDIDGGASKTDESRNVIRGPIASRRGRGRGRGRGKFQAFGKSSASNAWDIHSQRINYHIKFFFLLTLFRWNGSICFLFSLNYSSD